MVNVIFTRHKLTAEQLAEIGTIDLDCSDLAAKNIESLQDANDIRDELMARIGDPLKRIVRLYGVIPTPLRHVFFLSGEEIEIYEAFNVMRSVEGQKPTFQHKGWLRVK